MLTEKDFERLKNIYPSGGIKFLDCYININGNNYESAVSVYKYSPEDVGALWLIDFFREPRSIVSMDVRSINRRIVEKGIENSIGENLYELKKSNKNTAEIDVPIKLRKHIALQEKIREEDEEFKEVDLNIYVSGKNKKELEDEVARVSDILDYERMKGSIQMNLTKEYFEGKIFPNYQIKHVIPSETLAVSYPFYHSSLSDKRGFYKGKTITGGPVLLNSYHKDEYRKSYHSYYSGTTGAGKTTALKMEITEALMRGYKVFVFDVDGEQKKLAKSYGGKIVSIDGSHGMLNLLEIMQIEDDEEGINPYGMHTEKIKSFFQALFPNLEEDVLNDLAVYLHEFYSMKGLANRNDYNKMKPTDFPVLQDFKVWLLLKETELRQFFHDKDDQDKMLSFEMDKDNLINIKKILKCLRLVTKKTVLDCEDSNSMNDNQDGLYASWFDGHSTLDIRNENYVTFDVSSIRSNISSVYQAQLINILSLIWGITLGNRPTNNRLLAEGRMNEFVFVVTVLDEAHYYLTGKYPHALDFIEKFLRQGRKYYYRTILADQDLKPYYGVISDTNSKAKTILGLCTYKNFMNQESENLPLIKQLANKIPDALLNSIPYLKQGEIIFIMPSETDSSGCYRYKLDVSEYELKIFDGSQ